MAPLTFTWFGREFDLFDHSYNATLANERAVEVPLAVEWLTDRVMSDGLEIGNVLSHYGAPAHRIVDLHEQAAGVENMDLFDVTERFDWVLSISTIEHSVDPVAALDHLRSLLAPGGLLFVTIPGGISTELDCYLAHEGADASRCGTLVRSGGGWYQTLGLAFLPYGWSSGHAESVFIGEWEAE